MIGGVQSYFNAETTSILDHKPAIPHMVGNITFCELI